ncbi:MAG: arsenic efflux protein [Muribaculaceae bacterium]|nr:arsenic efflux protein [Muribaculaceae bacterium]
MLDIIGDTLLDGVKLLPFLFCTYLVMESLEHMSGSKMQSVIQKAGKSGPILGSILGAFPQCGFSAAASNLYAGRIITLGTLLSIYLSTSDEMLPILISEKAGAPMIFKILGMKILIGMAAGLVIDFIISRVLKKKKEELQIEHMCEHSHCHCEEGVVKSALRHTLDIFVYIIVITFILNLLVDFVGEEFLANLILNRPVIGTLIAGAVGLLPNCAASIVITELYLQGILGAGAMIGGLLVGAGVGLLVLLRVNDRPAENAKIIALLYGIGVISGIAVELLGISF